VNSTSGEVRKGKACEQLEKVTAEGKMLRTRQELAAAEVKRLHDQIGAAERAGDQKALDHLRQERQRHKEVCEDITRLLPPVDRDVVLAEAELRAATVQRHAELYNTIVEQQRRLSEVILEALHTLSDSLKAKEDLANQQQQFCMRELGWFRDQLRPATISFSYL
jgi:hypothetical protein